MNFHFVLDFDVLDWCLRILVHVYQICTCHVVRRRKRAMDVAGWHVWIASLCPRRGQTPEVQWWQIRHGLKLQLLRR